MKAVVLFSGGLDSTVLLHKVARGFDCYPLTLYYGQKHNREVEVAKSLWWGDSDKHKILDLGILSEVLYSALTTNSLDIPEGPYTVENQAQTVVPNRNMIFLSIAVGYALSIGAPAVFYGAHKNDEAIYADCRPDFILTMQKCIQLSTSNSVYLHAPFVENTKREIVSLGRQLKVPLSSTYSCYKGSILHCGVCGTCYERRKAFKDSGIHDYTKYAQKEEGNV